MVLSKPQKNPSLGWWALAYRSVGASWMSTWLQWLWWVLLQPQGRGITNLIAGPDRFYDFTSVLDYVELKWSLTDYEVFSVESHLISLGPFTLCQNPPTQTSKKWNKILEEHWEIKAVLMRKCCHFTEECDRISCASPEETTISFSYRKTQILEAYQVKWNGGMPSRQAISLQKWRLQQVWIYSRFLYLTMLYSICIWNFNCSTGIITVLLKMYRRLPDKLMKTASEPEWRLKAPQHRSLQSNGLERRILNGIRALQKERSKREEGRNGFAGMKIPVFHSQKENYLFDRYYCLRPLLIIFFV